LSKALPESPQVVADQFQLAAITAANAF
jgi:hypothetical protein